MSERLVVLDETGPWSRATSCVAFGMPKEAILRGAVDQVLPLSRIPWALLQAATTERRRAGATASNLK